MHEGFVNQPIWLAVEVEEGSAVDIIMATTIVVSYSIIKSLRGFDDCSLRASAV